MSKHFPQLKLSTEAKRDLKKLPQVTLKTTLFTAKGPAVGTIWQSTGLPEAMIVKSVKDGTVQYVDGWDHLTDFMESVDNGRYILIGVCNPLIEYVPLVIA